MQFYAIFSHFYAIFFAIFCPKNSQMPLFSSIPGEFFALLDRFSENGCEEVKKWAQRIQMDGM
jgi:hypothetical protein